MKKKADIPATAPSSTGSATVFDLDTGEIYFSNDQCVCASICSVVSIIRVMD